MAPAVVERIITAPFTHIIWTAATAAALWRVKGEKPFQWAMFGESRFLRVFILIVALHALYNSPLVIPMLGPALGFWSLRLAIGLVGWIIVLLLIQAGIRQVRDAQKQTNLN